MVTDKNCGIYKITSPSGRVYIGQSVNIKSRFLCYKHIKGKGQPILQGSFKKYGVENHQFDIIEYCSEDELNCSERFWQEEFDVLNGGLNCVLQECGEKRRYNSEEIGNKSSINNSKSIEVINTLTGVRYRSIGYASKITGICKSKLKNSLNGTAINNTTFRYAFEFDNNIPEKVKENRNTKKVIDTKTLTIFNSVKEASKYYNINHNTLSDWLNGKYISKTNLIYIEEEPKKQPRSSGSIKIKDTKTDIIYESLTEASKKLGINICTLRYNLKEGNTNKTSLVKL